VGTVKRLTVAVLVDGNYEVAKDAAGKETRKYKKKLRGNLKMKLG